MTDVPYRGPAAWMRDNAFILILGGAVALAVIGDSVARSGINPSDDPKFAQSPAADTQPQANQPTAEKKQAEAPAEGSAATGGSGEESVATGQSPAAAESEKPAGDAAKQDVQPPAPQEEGAGKP
jgi:hypothetical protein